MPKDLILHDLSPDEATHLFGDLPDAALFYADPAYAHCLGCFGCWIKTPGRCVLPDNGSDFAPRMAGCERLVIVSRLCFGGPSPAVKAVLDRGIGFMLPFFETAFGEMHHVQRYEHPPELLFLYHGPARGEAEEETARRLAAANARNFAMPAHAVHFCHEAAEMREVLA